MANPEHVELVRQGPEAIAKWQAENPVVKLDLSGADLTGADLRGDTLRGATLTEAILDRADLTGADLRGASLTGATLREATLTKATLYRADLTRAELGRADLTGADLLDASLTEASLLEADLTRAELGRADLTGATLTGATLTRASLFEATLKGATLLRADLTRADLARADLTEARLTGATLTGANLFEVRGAEHAYHLETVQFSSAGDSHGANARNDACYFETCDRPWPERWFDWERLRVVGRLPLFGISYTALILIPIVFYGLALYNDKIALVRGLAEQVIALPDHPWHRQASFLLGRLHPRPIPSLSFLLLLSTGLLAAGSTLYTFFGPSRIKEFSRDQWCDQIGRSLLHYWPVAWKYRYIRLACATCYAIGGAGAAWVLGSKVWYTAVFIWKNTRPSPWW